MNFFRAPSNTGAAWHRVGLVSEFPDLAEETDNKGRVRLGCKAFTISKPNEPQEAPVEADLDIPDNLANQVLVFKYKGKINAVDHQCPHSSFPLSRGSLFDIEDFGIPLSAGIMCPKHGWCFDIFSGQGDRANYKLKIWEVQLRDVPPSEGNDSEKDDKEVWVRRKQRIG